MRKVNLVIQVIEKRIANADHVLDGMSSERRLCEELGMSRTTVRAAVRKLVNNGVLTREKNGRLSVREAGIATAVKTIGLVMPIHASADIEMWHHGVVGALEGFGVKFRPVTYVDTGDSVIADAISNFDGLFFIAKPGKIPTWLTSRMNDTRCRVVVLDRDETEAGIPSVIMFPAESERKLFDHLVALGHERIDCLNTQEQAEPRVEIWRQYLADKKLNGQLRQRLVQLPMETGYNVIRQTLAEGRPLASALFCTSGPAAVGAMRAMVEAGLEVGKDISICAVNDEGIGHYLHKTLTALESPPRTRYLRGAVEWMLGESQWKGPLLVQPEDVPLFKGESTGLAPSSPIVLAKK